MYTFINHNLSISIIPGADWIHLTCIKSGWGYSYRLFFAFTYSVIEFL